MISALSAIFKFDFGRNPQNCAIERRKMDGLCNYDWNWCLKLDVCKFWSNGLSSSSIDSHDFWSLSLRWLKLTLSKTSQKNDQEVKSNCDSALWHRETSSIERSSIVPALAVFCSVSFLRWPSWQARETHFHWFRQYFIVRFRLWCQWLSQRV